MMGRRSLLLSGAAITGLVIAGGFAATRAATVATVGQPAPEFAVADTSGRMRRLDEFKGKIVVLEWTSSSCPFTAAHYTNGVMQALQKWATDRGVIWLSVLSTDPSHTDYLPPAEAEAYDRKRGGAPTALLMDQNGIMGHAYGARTTPGMFVISATGVVVYEGAIDDHPSYDPAVVLKSHNLVRAALEDIAAGRPVAIPSTQPYGCAVGYGAT
jgi:hypothetical protein